MATCELGYFNYHERDPKEERMNAYEEQFYGEAIESFERLCKFNAEEICKSVAWAYLEEAPEAEKVWKDLGLGYRHALIVAGRTEDFWDPAYRNMPDYIY